MTYTLPPLPPELEPFRAQIEASVRPYVKITTTLSDSTSPFDSKFGGYPYLPLDVPYPRDLTGAPMMLLAQINFAEVPHIDPYPETGILQFYLTRTELLYFGCDFDHPAIQMDWRVLWHPEVIKDETKITVDFSFLPDDAALQNDSPLVFGKSDKRGQALRLSFTHDHQPITDMDYRFEWLLSGEIQGNGFLDDSSKRNWKTVSLYRDIVFYADSHQIGGYPNFKQTDPRKWDKDHIRIPPDIENHSALLLQIASDNQNIMWGDVGIANFFIDRDDLIRRDFSRVLYNWDCS